VSPPPLPLERAFYARDPREVAPELLNKLLICGRRVVRIVEVEAYCGPIDPGSHAYRGLSRRNAVMFGPAGHLYVYFTYGMHWCANAVCGDEGEGLAVLLRAAAPVGGLDDMRLARFGPSPLHRSGRLRRPPAVQRDRDLCSGPAKLAQALGITGEQNGVDLVTGDGGVIVASDGTAPPCSPAVSRRIGLTAGAEHPWRWYVEGDPNVSRRAAEFGSTGAGSSPGRTRGGGAGPEQRA
jgi:DNA-3-methyladenine glycosylase